MSWSVRIVAPATPTEFGYVQPWLLEAGDAGGMATLLLHAGPYDVQLDPEDSFSPIWRSGFLPATNAVERSMSVDAASGGDWDQVRSTTVLIADQMSDETTMSAFIAAQGILLHGATVELYDGIPVAGEALPPRYWTGKIVQAMPDDMSIKLVCEPDGDTDPIGELLETSVIRPIVIGHAYNVPLAVLQDETIHPQLTVQGYADYGARPTKEWAAANGSHDFGVEMPAFPSLRTAPAEYMILRTDRRIFVFINAKLPTDDEFLDYFPGGVVTDRNWLLECVSGDGKGGMRPIELGTSVSVWRGSGSDPHLLGPLPFDPWHNPSPYETGYISFQLSPFFATYDAWSTIGTFDLFHDPRLSGNYTDSEDARISYLRLARRDLRLAKPQHASSIAFKFRTDDTFGSYESFDVVDEGDRYLVDLRRHPDDSAHLFQKLEILSNIDVRTQAIPPTMTGSVGDLFELDGGELTVTGDFRILNIGIRRKRPDGTTIADALAGAKRVWLSIDASYSGYLKATISLKGRQSGSAFERTALPNVWRNEILPNTLASASKTFSPENGGVRLLFDWEPGYSSALPKGTQGGLTMEIPSELDCAQYLEIKLDYSSALDHNTIWYQRAAFTDDLVIRRLALHLEREVAIDSAWSDIVGPTYLSCPGGINRPDGMGGTINSFAIERNAYDGIPLSSGLSYDQVIDDHAHAIEALLRISGHHGDTIDVQSIETAYWDMVCKTRTSLMPQPVESRPKCAFALVDTTQAGDVYAQLCRDGGLIGGRDASNRRTLKAFLARTWLEEQDYTLRDVYEDGTPGDFLRGSVKPGRTSLDDVVTSPLIRYAMEDGSATAYIQVLHPEADAFDPSYCVGFVNDTDAQVAWEICHKGWQRTGVVHARELTMASVYDYDSLIKLLMPQRGCGQLEWMVQQKDTLAYTISEQHAAATAPDGSRMLLHHWLRAPSGLYGTLVSTASKRGSDEATQTVILDPAP